MNSFLLKNTSRQSPRISSGSVVIPNKYSFRLVRRVGFREESHYRPLQDAYRQVDIPKPVRAVAHTEEIPEHSPVAHQQSLQSASKKQSIDESKRLFLRLAGIAGLGVVASTVLPKKAEAYVMGSSPTSAVVGMKNSSNVRIDPATESGNLATIATNTNTLTASGAGGYIRQDSTATIALETGGNLATLAGKDFATQTTLAAIKTQTDKFTFSGSNLLTSGGAGGGATTLQDTTGTTINPATDDSVVYLRRMVKLMESQAAVDSANRQRITIDSLGTGTAVTTTMPVSGTVTATVSLSAGANAIGSITAIDGQGHQMFQDWARQAYNSGIRGNLIFS